MQVLLERERLTLGAPLHQGAAGAFHAHPNDQRVGIKIYHKPEEMDAQRIEFLCSNPPPNLTEQGLPTHAWPLQIAYNEATGDPSGFSLTRATNVLPLQAFVDPASRPAGVSPAFLWKISMSVVKRIQTLHLLSPAHIAADINFYNFVVHRCGVVTQLDLDSTHFSIRGGRTFLCDRCRPELQPPELVSTQGEVLERYQHQDAFTTFIMIHRLIRDGLHPFDAHYVGAGNQLPLTELIRQGIWPDSQLHQDYRPIPGVPPFASLPRSIQDIFRRMFKDGAFDASKRPNVSELLVELDRHKPVGTSGAAMSLGDWRSALNLSTPAPCPRVHGNLNGGRAVAMAAAVASLSAIAYLGISRQRTAGDSRYQPAVRLQSDALPQSNVDVSSRRLAGMMRFYAQRPEPAVEVSASSIEHVPPPSADPVDALPKAQGNSPASVNLPTPRLWQEAQSQIELSSRKR